MKLLEAVLRGLKPHQPVQSQPELQPIPRNLVLCQNSDFSEQSTRPWSSDPRNGMVRYLGGYTMKMRKNVKKVTVFRYLLSKLIIDKYDGLHLDEYIVLNHLWLDFLEEVDPTFVAKYGLHLQQSLQLYTQVTQARNFPLRTDNTDEERKQILTWLGPLAMSPESYFGMKGNRNIRDSFIISFADSKLPLRIPPARYIGVGYKDKGTRQKTEIDGSPSWKEVGQEASNLEGAISKLSESELSSLRSSSLEEKTKQL